jgi:SAM-dependent methyltransferase
MQEGVLERMREIEDRHWWFRARLEIVLALMHRWVPPGARVLDVGCGTGYFLDAAKQTWEVWGIDPAAEAVAFCRERGLEHVSVGSLDRLGDLAFPRFDAVCFFDVLEHLDDDIDALRAAASLLAPGGLVIATVPAYQWLWSSHDTLNHHRRRYTRTQLGRALRQARFTPLELGYYNSRLFPLALVERGIKRLRPDKSALLLPIPPRPVNELLRRVLLSEKARLTGERPRPFRFGLSLLTVARLDNGTRVEESTAVESRRNNR